MRGLTIEPMILMWLAVAYLFTSLMVPQYQKDLLMVTGGVAVFIIIFFSICVIIVWASPSNKYVTRDFMTAAEINLMWTLLAGLWCAWFAALIGLLFRHSKN